VEIWLFFYEGLDEKLEKEYYTKWNSGLKQNTNDFIKQYWADIPITKMMEKDPPQFPYKVTPAWTSNSIEFKQLVGAYLTKNDKLFNGGFSGGAMDFILESTKLKEEDGTEIGRFLFHYIDIFGVPSKKENSYYKQAVFYSLMRIWLDNIKTLGIDKIKTYFRRKIIGHCKISWYRGLGGTRENSKACHRDLLEALNGGRKQRIFV
jgi:hypothetical protein